MSVDELKQRADLKAKVEYVGREVQQLSEVVTPAVDQIKGQLVDLKTQVRDFMVPEVTKENEALRLSNSELRSELDKCLRDLHHFSAAHASEYAQRRYRELSAILSKG